MERPSKPSNVRRCLLIPSFCQTETNSQSRDHYKWEPTEWKHSRYATTVVKDISQSYRFVSALSHEASNNSSEAKICTNEQLQKGYRFIQVKPTDAYCPACKVTNKTTLNRIIQNKSVWSQFFCCNPSKAYTARFSCSECFLPLIEINYKAKI